MIIQLRELWMQGLSSPAIGLQLGVSKSAVLAKVHRPDLPKRRSPIKMSADLADVATQQILDALPVASVGLEPAVSPQSAPPAEVVQPMLLPETEPTTSLQPRASP